MFRRSPLKFLQEHMRVVMDCVREVPPLFDTLIEGDKEKFASIKDKIFEHEATADKIKNELRAGLPKSLCSCPWTGVICSRSCSSRIPLPIRRRI